ncbi:MAG TPA: T9SS type A sorting domain-containing protein [Saprospiraceae bacterium]|nr:T9SS type A sorting domain-containing protein [Saprospiraceae bacterium]
MKNILLSVLVAIGTCLNAQHTVYFSLEPVELNTTEKIYNFIVSDFVDMVGWQFSMLFDGTKMRFKEIRNPILDDLTNHDFNEPHSGILLTAWIDRDLQSLDYIEPTVAFQLVFELLSPEGADVCLSETPLSYEFIVHDSPGHIFLSEVVINDDCHVSFPIQLNTTAVDDPASGGTELIDQVYLSTQGELSFTNTTEQNLSLQLFDILGRPVVNFGNVLYPSGRSTLDTGRKISDGLYILHMTNDHGKTFTSTIIAQ